jgi:hypothetical protein
MPLCKWAEEDWNTLLCAIQIKKCILMLGPETAVASLDGQPKLLSQSLADLLIQDIGPQFKENIDHSSLMEVAQYYCVEKEVDSYIVKTKMYDFYFRQWSALTSNFYRDLAALPFYLSIHSSPDLMFDAALKEQGKKPEAGWYNYKEKKSTMKFIGTKDNPMLFYLYGYIHDEESLVATENDLLNFLVSITAEKSLPDRLINELKAPDISFLFLGFGFKHWYLRILLHILKIQNKTSHSFALEDFTPHSEAEFKSTVLFFGKGPFKIHFFEKGFEEFAAELRRRFEAKIEVATPKEAVPIHEEKRPRVFICHASEDNPFAASLYEQLKAAGLEPWLDEENLRGGDKWDEMIQQVIKKEIDYFLVLQSESLQKKTRGKCYINKEINEALEQQKMLPSGSCFIIPLKIGDCKILEDINHLQTIQIDDRDNIAKLILLIEEDYKTRGN